MGDMLGTGRRGRRNGGVVDLLDLTFPRPIGRGARADGEGKREWPMAGWVVDPEVVGAGVSSTGWCWTSSAALAVEKG